MGVVLIHLVFLTVHPTSKMFVSSRQSDERVLGNPHLEVRVRRLDVNLKLWPGEFQLGPRASSLMLDPFSSSLLVVCEQEVSNLMGF